MQLSNLNLWAAGSWPLNLEFLSLRASECKCTSLDSCWPSIAEFEALNRSTSGRLIRGVPPGSVCYPGQPDFDEERCEFVRQNWFTSSFHADDPISIGFPAWADNACPPIYPNGTSVTGDPNAGVKGCSLGASPLYALNATSIEDIQTVVHFAKAKNIRLNVKSTGHSVEGRSTAPESISIWTHHFLSHEYHAKFRPVSCPGTYPENMAVSLGAGARMRDLYEFSYQNNVIVVGGSGEDVGIVGWLTGGGLGPLTSRFGQGSDNILQATIVTPNGEVITANECRNTDLFWAIRGGGGGTFGILAHVTMRAYSAPSAVLHQLDIVLSDPDHEAAFWKVLAGVYSLVPDLKAKGFSGNIFMDRPPQVPQLSLHWNLNLLIAESSVDSIHKAKHALELLLSYLDTQKAHISFKSALKFYPSWFQSWNHTVRSEPHTVAEFGLAMASRLIPAASLVNNTDNLGQTLQSISESVSGFQAHLGPHEPSHSSPHLSGAPTVHELNKTSLPPHWNAATLQFFTLTTFPDSASAAEKRTVFEHATNGPGKLLKELAPSGGAYINEDDAFNPDWQMDFFGTHDNYESLRRVKDQVDPDGQLWCVSCVGSEAWTEDESGRLCRAA